VIAALTAVLGLLKGLPLAYQRDLQEDKPPLFGAIATLEASLGVMSGLIATLTIDAARMREAADEGYTTATAVADALVRRGVPFRAAHHVVGRLVGQAERDGVRRLEDLPDVAFRGALAASDDPAATELAADGGIAAELRRAGTLEGALAAPDVIGGTNPARVVEALETARRRLEQRPA
jgi:argininosuccinate lyase